MEKINERLLFLKTKSHFLIPIYRKLRKTLSKLDLSFAQLSLSLFMLFLYLNDWNMVWDIGEVQATFGIVLIYHWHTWFSNCFIKGHRPATTPLYLYTERFNLGAEERIRKLYFWWISLTINWSIMIPWTKKEVQISCKKLRGPKDPPPMSNRWSESPWVIGLKQISICKFWVQNQIRLNIGTSSDPV